MKQCTKCGATKSLTEFWNSSRTKDGKLSQCRRCVGETHRVWYAAHPDKQREQSRRWREANPGKVREKIRAWAETNPEKRQKSQTNLKERNYSKLREMFGPACLDCGWELPMPVFVYHHLDPTTKHGKLHIAGWAWKRVEIYVRGCVQLCPTCHSLRHFLERKKSAAVVISDVMSKAPAWCKDLPVACETGISKSYGEAK